MFLGLRGEEPHPFAGLVNAHQCHEIGFPSRFICPQRLADLGLVAFRVEQIIRNLIGEAQIMREAMKGMDAEQTLSAAAYSSAIIGFIRRAALQHVDEHGGERAAGRSGMAQIRIGGPAGAHALIRPPKRVGRAPVGVEIDAEARADRLETDPLLRRQRRGGPGAQKSRRRDFHGDLVRRSPRRPRIRRRDCP